VALSFFTAGIAEINKNHPFLPAITRSCLWVALLSNTLQPVELAADPAAFFF
jgi:hypothetical protein